MLKHLNVVTREVAFLFVIEILRYDKFHITICNSRAIPNKSLETCWRKQYIVIHAVCNAIVLVLLT